MRCFLILFLTAWVSEAVFIKKVENAEKSKAGVTDLLPDTSLGDNSVETKLDDVLLEYKALASQQEAFQVGGLAERSPDDRGGIAQHSPEEDLGQQVLHSRSVVTDFASEAPNDPFKDHQRSVWIKLLITLAEVILCSLLHCASFTVFSRVFKKSGIHVEIGVIAVIVFIVGCVLTLFQVYWAFDDGALYLDTTGTLFVMEIATISVLTPIIYFQFTKNAEAQQPGQEPYADAVATDAKALKINTEDIPIFAVMVLRGIFNTSMVAYAEADLPARDPNERMNGAKYIVILFEYLYLFIHVVCFLGSTVGFIGVGNSVSRGVYVKLAVHNLQQISGGSFLQAFPFAHPMSFFDDLTLSNLMESVHTVVKLLNVPMAFLGLLVKVDMISFISTADVSDWSWGDWLLLLAFTNNLAGMLPNSYNQGITAVFRAIDSKNIAQNEAKWRVNLSEKLSKEHGSLKAMAKYWNLHASDVDIEQLKDELFGGTSLRKFGKFGGAGPAVSGTDQQKQRVCW